MNDDFYCGNCGKYKKVSVKCLTRPVNRKPICNDCNANAIEAVARDKRQSKLLTKRSNV